MIKQMRNKFVRNAYVSEWNLPTDFVDNYK